VLEEEIHGPSNEIDTTYHRNISIELALPISDELP
jgi:hypothetical protein